MRRLPLLSTVCFSLLLSAATAQRRPGSAYFLRHRATGPRLGTPQALSGPVPASSAVVPLPAATDAPVPTVPQYDLNSAVNFPLHVPPSLPEPGRMYMPPAVYVEPGGRGMLGR